MKLIDLNLLLYALDEDSAHHEVARGWLEETLSGNETVAMPWVVLLGFLRISTRTAAFASPLSPEQALAIVEGWLDQPPVTVVHPGRRHLTVLRDLLGAAGTAGNLVTDAHLAALAIEHDAELQSADTDFARFSGLRWRNPLV